MFSRPVCQFKIPIKEPSTMDKLIQLSADIVKLWTKYGDSYIVGMRNTLILALAATAIGCIIGFICGILNTRP